MTPQIKTYLVIIDLKSPDGAVHSRPICGMPTREEANAQGAKLMQIMSKPADDGTHVVGHWVEPITVYLPT